MEQKEIYYEYKEKLEQAGITYEELPKDARVKKLIDKIAIAEERYNEASEEDDTEEAQIQFEKIDLADKELCAEIDKYLENLNEQKLQKEEAERQAQAKKEQEEKEAQELEEKDEKQPEKLAPWDLRNLFPGLK
jgi:hypothetical protein